MQAHTCLKFHEKIGQLFILGFEGESVNDEHVIAHSIQNTLLGGVILFDYHFEKKKFDHNIKNPGQLRSLTTTLQHLNQKAWAHRKCDDLPLLIGVDYEGGRVNRLKPNYGFPMAPAAGELEHLSLDSIDKIGLCMAKTLKRAGCNLNFAPTLDLNLNPDNPIIGKLQRSYSSDPTLVITIAKRLIDIYNQHGVACVIKHFPGHGSSTGDTHLGIVDISETWQPIELEPYLKLIPTLSALNAIMTSHVIHAGFDKALRPASLSRAITTSLLRNQLQYHGVVMTDDLQMQAIAAQFGLKEAVCLAINAGADVLVFGNQLSQERVQAEDLVAIVAEAVIKGDIARERIEASFNRIMTMKQRLKLSQTNTLNNPVDEKK